MSAFKPFLQYFATGSDTASCQDCEEYEFVECLSEETQIISIFTHRKLQPHKLSHWTLSTRLSSCFEFSVADPGKGPRGPSPPLPPLLFLHQTEARRAENSFLRDPPPTPFSQGLDPAVVLDSIR